MPIPDQLPSELIPPSSRDLNDSVDLVKDLLKHETRSRSPASIDAPISRLKNRSFNSSSPSLEANRDATIYKHSDEPPPSGFYKPRSRHVDRDAIRSRDDDDSPTADLSDMKRQLANTAQMLERTAQAEATRTQEDEELDQEMDDLKYRVKRVRDDLDYNARPPRTSSKEEERRRLERELLSLMHERIPEVERKIKAREERKEKEKRQWARDRDRANDRHGRYDDKDDYYRRNNDHDRLYSRGSDDRDRPYSRGGYNRDDRERDSYRRERSLSRDRDYERPRSSAARSTPPPVSAPASSVRDTPPIPQQSKATMSPRPDVKNMTPAERQAFIKAEGQKLTQARMAVLGVTVPPSAPALDTSVEDRLQQEKREAEEKAKAAEKQAEERERARKERLDNARSLKEGKTTPVPSTPSPTVATPPRAPAPAPALPKASKAAPPPPKARAPPAPPPPRRVLHASPVAAPKPPVLVMPSEPEIDHEEELLRAREAELRKKREEREAQFQAKFKLLEAEEEEARRQEEMRYQARVQALRAKIPKSPTPPLAPIAPTPVLQPHPPSSAQSPSPVLPPPALAQSPIPSPAAEKSTNPFSRLIKEGGSSAPVATGGSNSNPWSKAQTAQPPSDLASRKSPVPSIVKTSYNTAPSSIDDDWDEIKENDDSDASSDDEIAQSRSARANIAQQLFGNILPRPTSAAASAPSSIAPPPPPPPPPPAASALPTAPITSVAAPSGNDVSALMQSIQGGMKLRPTKTVDRSAPPTAGRVIGEVAPPPHISASVQSTSPPSVIQPQTAPMVTDNSAQSGHRHSVGWFADRAADVDVAPDEIQRLPSTMEDDEEDIYHSPPVADIPKILVDESVVEPVSDLMADIDKSIRKSFLHDQYSSYVHI
jgi:actin cytoskeleton-regulatory complex protein PAN1